MTPSEYKKFKGLKRQNLRDHMNDLELIFSMLGERVSTEITRNKDAKVLMRTKMLLKKAAKLQAMQEKMQKKE